MDNLVIAGPGFGRGRSDFFLSYAAAIEAIKLLTASGV
jgi:hypothetical protein